MRFKVIMSPCHVLRIRTEESLSLGWGERERSLVNQDYSQPTRKVFIHSSMDFGSPLELAPQHHIYLSWNVWNIKLSTLLEFPAMCPKDKTRCYQMTGVPMASLIFTATPSVKFPLLS